MSEFERHLAPVIVILFGFVVLVAWSHRWERPVYRNPVALLFFLSCTPLFVLGGLDPILAGLLGAQLALGAALTIPWPPGERKGPKSQW